jgi:ubiquinone biosynthesis protein UbiJ
MKNEKRIEELLADLLRSSDRQEEQLKGLTTEVNQGFQMLDESLNRNFTQIDENFRLITKQFELMNEKFDKVIALDEKVKEIDKRLKALENKIL